MAFDWREYLALARYIHTQSGSGFSLEASSRSAVSRAYYAAFCQARNYAQQHLGYVSTRSAKDHEDVRQYFRQSRRLQIASDLDRLRQWRNQCDYNDNVPNLSQMLMSAMQRAEDTLSALP